MRGTLKGGGARSRLLPLPFVFCVLLAAITAIASGCGTEATHAQIEGTLGSHAQARQVPHRGASIVATAIAATVPIFHSPGARRPFRTLASPTTVGEPLVFLVRGRRPGWESVYLPVRPDGSTGWIRDQDVTLAWNPFNLRVRLGPRVLVVRKSGSVIARYRVGVGRTVLPTPTGRYYIVELLKQPDPKGLYGPYAFGTSAFSHVLYSFGGGPGQIGIHGTNDPSSVGRSVSHGCIRLSNAAITRLAQELPLGTPVTITR